jgi:hypothetical protein
MRRADPVADDLRARILQALNSTPAAAVRNGTDYCPAAGDYRNQVFVDMRPVVALACLVPGFKCNGTRDCAARAEAARIPVRWITQGAR